MYSELEKDIDNFSKNSGDGKGSLYRIPLTDKKYQANYNKIFKKNKKIGSK